MARSRSRTAADNRWSRAIVPTANAATTAMSIDSGDSDPPTAATAPSTATAAAASNPHVNLLEAELVHVEPAPGPDQPALHIGAATQHRPSSSAKRRTAGPNTATTAVQVGRPGRRSGSATSTRATPTPATAPTNQPAATDVTGSSDLSVGSSRSVVGVASPRRRCRGLQDQQRRSS